MTHKEIYDLYQQAEDKIKLIERIEGLSFPATNQLRYAGNHILRALNAKRKNKAREEWEKARNHCQRAVYDACEAGINYYLKKINDFKEEYGVPLSQIIDGYGDQLIRVREIQGFILNYSSKDETKQKYYQKAGENLSELIRIFDKFDAVRDEAAKINIRERRITILQFVGLIITAIGMLIAAAPFLKKTSEYLLKLLSAA